MKKAVIALALALGLPGAAAAQDITTILSDELQKKLTEDYGEREAEVLIEKLESKVRRELENSDASVDSIALTIVNAAPNRPTFNQMSERPGLDPIRSISLGGAKITGVAYDAAGTEIVDYTYRWFSRDLNQVIGASVWWDANRAFSRFADRFVDKIEDADLSPASDSPDADG